MNNILVVSPHLDDDILGCGGLMSILRNEGKNVYVAFITNGNVGAPELFPEEGTMRGRKEAMESHKVLGVKETFFYDFPCPRLDTYPNYKISLEINGLIKKLNIDTLLVPHRGDIHVDHRVVFETSLVAARPTGDNPVRLVLAYETLSETDWAAPFSDGAFIPTFFIELSHRNLEDKCKAFDCYTSPRKKEYPHSRSIDGLRTLARMRGSTISKEYAECYMVIREIKYQQQHDKLKDN